jgi:hypothetical protein
MDSKITAVYNELYGLIAERSAEYDQGVKDQCAVWEGRIPEHQPLLLNDLLPNESSYPKFTTREIHFDKDKMLLTGMIGMASAALGGMQAVPSIRANMGCGIYPSMLPGIKSMLFDDDRAPWVIEHLDKDTIKKIRHKDIKITDEFKLGLEHMAYMVEKIKGTGTYIFPLDQQDPIDVAHIIYGDQFFYDLYDEPEFIHHLLDLSCYAIETGMSECLKIIPHSDKAIAHQNEMIMPRSLGAVKFSMDTSTLLGAEHIDEFTIPYLKRLLNFTGGCYVHFCGRNDHFLDELMKLNMVRGINLGNPEKHDMESFLHRLAMAGKVYYGPVPKEKDESYERYFLRISAAATDSAGRCWLLLTMSAPKGEVEEIRSAWRS